MDYKQIIDNLDINSIVELMKKLGADRYEEKEKFFIFPTICHNINSAEASMKLYLYKDTKLFVCYTEDGNMSIFKFLKTYYETRQIEYDWFEDMYNVVLNCGNFRPKEGFDTIQYQSLKDRYRIKKKQVELEKYPSGILDIFMKNYPVEWLNDGISRRAMDKYNIKYSVSQNKIIIPHYDINNNLIGIRGRALNEWEIENIGKYMPIQIEKKWYTHPLSLNLYGLNHTKENIKKYGICYIGEAEKFCLQSESFSFPNCSCAVCGSQFNKYQLDILMKNCRPKEIVICFDKEEKDKEDKYFFKLYNLCKKYINYCKMSFIYDNDNLLKLKESPTDCGENIFKKLLEKRIIVK